MPNRLLHILTNSPGPFDAIHVPRNTGFVPRRLRKDQTDFRKLLCLDQSPWHAAAMITALHAHPDIAGYVESGVNTFVPIKLPPSGISVTGAKFWSGDGQICRHVGSVQTLPVNTTFNIICMTDTLVTVTAPDIRQSAVVGARSHGTDPSKILRVYWPKFAPFVGDMVLTQTWAEGSSIEIVVAPRPFPYAELVRRAKPQPYLLTRLDALNLLSQFMLSADPIEQTAMIAAAIVTDTDVIPEIVLSDEVGLTMTVDQTITADTTMVTADTTEITADYYSA